MKRPFSLLGGAAFLALAAAACLGPDAAGPLVWICAGMGICALIVGKLPARRVPGAFLRALRAGGAALLAAALFLLLFCRAGGRQQEVVRALAEQKAEIRGTVLDYPRQAYHRTYYRVRVERVSVEGRPVELPVFTARISTWQPLRCRPYDAVECTVSFYAFDSGGGLYSTQNTRLAEGIFIGGYLSGGASVAPLSEGSVPPGRLLAEWRRKLGRGFQRLLPQREAGFLRALILGERDQLSEEVSRDFRALGISHLLVISGLHMTALAGLLSLLLGRLPRRLGSLLTALALLLFLAMIGFPASALRSGLMFLLTLLAGCVGRRADGLNSLGFAVFLICLFNPFAGGDLGFALSVFATAGILLWASPLSRAAESRLPARLRAAMRFPLRSLGMSLAAVLGTLPIQLLVFRGLSLWSPLATLVLILPCTLALYCGALGALFGLLPVLEPLHRLFCFPAGWLARLSEGVAAAMARWPGAFLDLTRPAALLGLGIVLLLAGTALYGAVLRKDRRITAGAAAAIFLLCLGGGLWSHAVKEQRLTAAAPADSACVVLMKGDRAAVLALGGYRSGAALELLRRSNIRRVEALCLPVTDADAREAAGELLSAFEVESVLLPEDAYAGRDLTESGAALRRLNEGGRLTVLDGVEITARYGMHRLEVWANGVLLLVERGSTEPGSCQLLFTDRTDSRINSAFTVAQNDAIMDTPGAAALVGMPAGEYLLPAGDGLYIDLLPTGDVQFRGESYGGDR